MKPLICLLAISLLVAGCSHPSDKTYDAKDVGKTIETAQGSVVSSRVVDITGETSGAGPLAGGAIGAVGVGLGTNNGWLALLGGVVGAGAGYIAQRQMNNREGVEYVVQMDDGRTVTIVQNRADSEPPLPNGTPVLVQYGGNYSRVIENPNAVSGGRPGGWVDPDAAADPGGSAAQSPYGSSSWQEPPPSDPSAPPSWRNQSQ